jgi:protein-L-isoaspartate(D-aspartate) O-methyltransferase
MAGLAYLDLDVPVGPGASGARRLIKPMVLAKLIQAADLGSHDRVLDIGCTTGYAAAVLRRIAGEVVALEEEPSLAATAGGILATDPNVSVVSGRLADGWRQRAPYEAIILEGAVEFIPQSLFEQLKDDGRLACVFGGGPAAKAMLYRRSGKQVGGREIFDAAAPLLPGFEKRPEFSF